MKPNESSDKLDKAQSPTNSTSGEDQPSANQAARKVAETATSEPLQQAVNTEEVSAIEVSETRDTSPSVPTEAGSKLGGVGWLVRIAIQSAAVIAVIAVVLVMLGVAQRINWITAGGFSGGGNDATATAAQASDSGEPKRYICPMMCTPPSTEPGRCPVCAMELVEATGGGGGDGISVTIEASARRLIGIQTAMSKMGSATRTIRTIGSIDFDESRLSTISAYIDGRLEKLYADYVGVRVEKGSDLALIYSPQLYTAQTEFVSSLNSSASVGRFSVGDLNLSAMARENLSELGMTDDQIELLQTSGKPQSRIRIKSPQSGTVIEKTAVEGDYVKTGQEIYRIADLSSVWMMLDVFPGDAALVRFGQQVEAEIQSMPGEVFTGRVAFIDPTVDSKTRTVRVRVEVMNFDGKLRPGDYATARITVPSIPTDFVYDPSLAGKYISPMHPQVIRDEPGKCPLCGFDLVPTSELGYAPEPQSDQRVVTVPRDAVLLTGENGVIYVETEPGRFEIRRISIGSMNDTDAVIIEGLAAGETVATAGNFLIDSQMQLAGNPSLLDPSKAPSYSPGPLELPERNPVMLSGTAAEQFDRTFAAYFEIQRAMAADMSPPPVALNTMLGGLSRLEMLAEVPDDAQKQIGIARLAATRMDGSLETAREAFRGVSHALLRAAGFAMGPKTGRGFYHMYCPMVQGGGGDWMQQEKELRNPYWGEEMLECGEVVREMRRQEDTERGRVGAVETALSGGNLK